MQVTLRLFAGAREAAGAANVTVTVRPGATVRDVVNAAVAEYPALARLAGIARIALNLEYVPDSTPVDASDEIALIPPVSGG